MSCENNVGLGLDSSLVVFCSARVLLVSHSHLMSFPLLALAVETRLDCHD